MTCPVSSPRRWCALEASKHRGQLLVVTAALVSCAAPAAVAPSDGSSPDEQGPPPRLAPPQQAVHVPTESVESESPLPLSDPAFAALEFEKLQDVDVDVDAWLAAEIHAGDALKLRADLSAHLGSDYRVILVDGTRWVLRRIVEEVEPVVEMSTAEAMRTREVDFGGFAERTRKALPRVRPKPKPGVFEEFEPHMPCGSPINQGDPAQACAVLVLRGGMDTLASHMAQEVELEPSGSVFFAMTADWARRFGAEVVVWGRNPVLEVARPPQDLRTLRELAWEFFLTCPMGPEGWSSEPEDAAELLGRLQGTYWVCGWFAP